jgi:hypothetical protein
MKILEVCTNYFHGFQDIAHCQRNDAKTNVLAMLKIVSYITIVIPLFFAALFTAASLCGRANKVESLSPQDLSISNQARKTIIKKDKPKTPQEIRDAAKKAAEGECIHTGGPSGHSYEKLIEMVNNAPTEEISYIIEGALSHQYSIGLKKALGELLRRRDLGGSAEKEKLKLSIKAITEERLLELVDKSELPSLAEQLEYLVEFDFYNDLELELLQKYGKELSLSDGGVKQIGDYIEHVRALCEKTRDKPQFMYE